MPEPYEPPDGVGTEVQIATVAEATGSHGKVFMRTNLQTLANKARFLDDDGYLTRGEWVEITLLNGWEDITGISPAEYKPAYSVGRDGVVRMRGRCRRTTGALNTQPLAVLPFELRIQSNPVTETQEAGQQRFPIWGAQISPEDYFVAAAQLSTQISPGNDGFFLQVPSILGATKNGETITEPLIDLSAISWRPYNR